LINKEKRFGKVTLVLLFLNLLTLAAIVTPVSAQAENPSITLSRSQGPAGTGVVAELSGFPAYVAIIITFGTTNVGTVTSTSENASVDFRVPPVSVGTYTVTAAGTLGGVATTVFIVAQKLSPTPTAAPALISTPTSTPVPTTSASVTQVWNCTISGSLSTPILAGDYFYVGSLDGNIYCFNALTGAKIWNFNTGAEVQYSPSVVDGIVYVCSTDNCIYALDALTGVELWDSTGSFFGSPVISDGFIYLQYADNNVVSSIICLNASTGTPVWTFMTGGSVGNPIVANDCIYIDGGDNNVYALNASTGAQIWTFPTAGYLYSPVLADNNIYFCASNGNNGYMMYALDASTGSQIWNYTTNSGTGSLYAVYGNMIYVTSYYNSVYGVFCLNVLTGAPIWSYATDYGVGWKPIVSGSYVYVATGGSVNGIVYALDALTGAKLWNYTTGTYWYQLAVSGGEVYIIDESGNVYALDALTGAKLWNYQTAGGDVFLVLGNYVYAFCEYPASNPSMSTIYALQQTKINLPKSSPTPAPTPTPSATPCVTTVPVTTDNCSSVDLRINGNITSAQMSNITITTDQSDNTTTVSFTVTGESGTTGFGNVTIPRSVVPYGTTPTIYIDGQSAQNQGHTQDSNNYYLWYTTHFSTHQISIVFTTTNSSTNLPSQSSLLQEVIYGAAVAVAIVAIVLGVLYLYFGKAEKAKNTKKLNSIEYSYGKRFVFSKPKTC
jgi:outer membrane protein assembly factor BamB